MDMDLTHSSIVPRPRNLQETGLSLHYLVDLVAKHLHTHGVADLPQLSKQIALSGNILEPVLGILRKKNLIETLAASHGSTGERYIL